MTNEELVDEESVFKFRGKEYKMHSFCPIPSVTMKCIGDDSLFSFGFDAPIRDEFVLNTERLNSPAPEAMMTMRP